MTVHELLSLRVSLKGSLETNKQKVLVVRVHLQFKG